MDAFRRFVAQLRAYWAGLGRLRRVAVVGVTAAVLLALGAVAYLSPGVAYVPLSATALPPEEVAAIRTRLTTASIPFRLADNGTNIEVPAARQAEARVTLAAEGIPARGGKGYELFDETSLMTTPFQQTVNYQRAIQGELQRSIMQLDPVQTARVMIARPEPTPFVRDQRPPTASVVLKLKPGAVMSRATAGSIVSLVARSVEGLKPEHVTVVDSGGRLLSDPHAGESEGLAGPQLEYRQSLERYLSTKAEEMLAQHLGAGRAVVRVSADVNFQQIKERTETYTPDGRVATAELLTNSQSSGGGGGGVAGATSNVARAGGPLTGQRGGGGSSSKEETIRTDYAASRTVRDSEDRMGGVTRLTIAALVDLAPPGEGQAVISADDAQEIIKQAVGFRAGRDEVKLTNVRLASAAPAPEPDQEAAQIARMQAYVSLARNVCLALAVVMALAIVPLLLLRRRRAAAPAPAEAAAGTPGAAAPATPEARRQADLDRLTELTRNEPDRVADVFKLLIGA